MSNTLIAEEDLQWEDLGGGIRRKLMAQDETMMLVKVAFEKGGVGAAHHHHHTQASTIESGVFEITIGDETKVLKAGDAYFVPSNVVHGAVCLEEGVLVDVFTPRRDDFLP
ncbi:cupin domain-containing protein [Jiulongibacter sp. NS-SX5]|uniref:cupin domain-containing protein n=1 Tax=Jiulongibacter sp. NS-SX5 TaxID=3463854 RepID=UPI00405A0D17